MKFKSDIYKKIILIVYFTGIICEFAVSFSGALIGGYKEPLIILAGMGLFCLTSVLAYDYKSLFTKQSVIELLVYIAVIAYSLLCYNYQHSALILRISLILISSRILNNRVNRNIVNTVLKIFFFGTGIILVLFAFLSAFGIHGSFSTTQNFRHTAETRYCFGFFHPNGFSMFYLKFILLGLYLYSNKLKVWLLVLLSIVFSIPLFLSDSKMVLLCYLFACCMTIIIKLAKDKDISKFLFLLSIVFISLIIGVVDATALIHQNFISLGNPHTLWDYMNDITSGRLYSMSKSFHSYDVNFLGYGNTLVTTENGYVNAMFSEGMIFVCIFIFASIWLLYRMYKEKNNIGIIVVTAVIISLFSESFMAYFNKNIVWMILMGYVGGNPESHKKGELL